MRGVWVGVWGVLQQCVSNSKVATQQHLKPDAYLPLLSLQCLWVTLKKAATFGCASNGAALGMSTFRGEANGCIRRRTAACHLGKTSGKYRVVSYKTVNKHSKKRTQR